jgi:exopolysaccharide biosynthesis polyprenyl glycosylphosphotransferase
MADISRSTPIFRFRATHDISEKFSRTGRSAPETDRGAMLFDSACVVGSAILACALVLDIKEGGLWEAIQAHLQHLWVAAVLALGYALTVIANCHRMSLYTPERHRSMAQEQRQVLQASLSSGMLLVAAFYLLHPRDPRTSIVLTAVALTTAILGLRRLVAWVLLQRCFLYGAGTRNALIVGTGETAQALRSHMENMGHLGYTFKGFIDATASSSGEACACADVIGTLESVFDDARRHFVDEIFFTLPCERTEIQDILDQARFENITIRLVPDLYDSSIFNPPVEYLGQFATIPLCRRRMRDSQLLMKRTLDLAIAIAALVTLLPLFLAIAALVKRDSSGPVFYVSERLGKKGRVFRCIKFRTMVQNAEALRLALLSRNQRDGILFKLDDDPRVTRVGRFLRKYSLDELPQLMNVLSGDMSIVGPRPPLAGEVKQYKPGHLRRLEVVPGITGLWQVQARRDPSFDKYVSLDMAYVENWSIRLDLAIMVRTVGVVLAGTGS